jgi:hypothetical protein
MSPSTRPPPPDPRFVRDVAKQLDRRRIRRRMVGWSALLAAVAAGTMYLRCGQGLGLGGAGEGPGPGPGSSRPLTEPRRCAIRLAGGGITVDGKPLLRDQAVEVCKAAGGANIVVTGNARHGDREDLTSALRAARVPFRLVDEPAGSSSSH